MAAPMAAAVARPAYFRAVAVDYDGTLAEGQVKPDTVAALAEARARQIRIILVTGRIMSELRAVFPDALEQVDAVVAENGAVLVTRTGSRLLAAPVSPAVSAGLSDRGVAHRCGQVLVAAAAVDEATVSAVIRELGLDCRLVRNRGELMILPAGVTKSSGLGAALDDLAAAAPPANQTEARSTFFCMEVPQKVPGPEGHKCTFAGAEGKGIQALGEALPF